MILRQESISRRLVEMLAATTRRLAVMNLALRGIEADLLPRFTSTFTLHPSNFVAALPGQLFYSTEIPVCLLFLVKSKAARVVKGSDNSTPVSFRERRRNRGIDSAVPAYRPRRRGRPKRTPLKINSAGHSAKRTRISVEFFTFAG